MLPPILSQIRYQIDPEIQPPPPVSAPAGASREHTSRVPARARTCERPAAAAAEASPWRGELDGLLRSFPDTPGGVWVGRWFEPLEARARDMGAELADVRRWLEWRKAQPFKAHVKFPLSIACSPDDFAAWFVTRSKKKEPAPVDDAPRPMVRRVAQRVERGASFQSSDQIADLLATVGGGMPVSPGVKRRRTALRVPGGGSYGPDPPPGLPGAERKSHHVQP